MTISEIELKVGEIASRMAQENGMIALPPVMQPGRWSVFHVRFEYNADQIAGYGAYRDVWFDAAEFTDASQIADTMVPRFQICAINKLLAVKAFMEGQ